MKRGVLLAALALTALATWALWPDPGAPAGASVSERARQGAPAADGLAARVIAGDDLPPEGTRSLFDHLVAQNEQLPYPFEKLVALVQAQDAEGRAPPALLIPDGRSLLKASAHFARPWTRAGRSCPSRSRAPRGSSITAAGCCDEVRST